MIEVEIPGFKSYRFLHLVLDVNGTIAKDGQLIEGVKELLAELQSSLRIHMVTADTYGSLEKISTQLNLLAVRIPKQGQAEAKLNYIEQLGADTVVAVGNGANDFLMLERAALGIVVVGPECCASAALLKSDVVAPGIHAALEMLLYPTRLIATLRR
jgi:P-type E1-E2 ATPase